MEADGLGRPFRLVDTGGWMAGGTDLDDKVSAQSERAMAEAHVVLFVVDVVTGPTEDDGRVAGLLRASGKPVLLVANKMDDTGPRAPDGWGADGPGPGRPYPVSALHGRGTGDLLDAVAAQPPPRPRTGGRRTGSTGRDDDTVAVAIVGRPNGASPTLFNRLTGDDRAVVHDLPGTTRDTVDTVVETELGPLRLVDTAGMRRRIEIDEGTEYYSLVRASGGGRGRRGPARHRRHRRRTDQDQRLAERIDAAGSPIVVVLNKWDLLDAEDRADLRWQVADRLRFIGDAPVLPVSASSGKGVHKLFPALEASVDAYRRRIPTAKVNAVIRTPSWPNPAPAAPGCCTPPRERPPAHVHAVRQPGVAPALPPLPRAQAPGGVRPGRHPGQAAGRGAVSDSLVTVGTMSHAASRSPAT